MGNKDKEAARLPAFQEEADRLVLSSPSFSVGFSKPAGGAVVSLHHHRSGVELVEAGEAAAEGALWVITLVSGTGSTVALTSRNCDTFTHSLSPGPRGDLHLELKWSGLRAGAAHLPGEVTARFLAPHEGRALTAELEFDLPEGLSVGAVEFPRVGSLGASDSLTEEQLFLPLGEGVLIPDPRALATRLEGKAWAVDYPGRASLQLLGYSRGPGLVLWLSARDETASRKTLAAGSMPHSNRLALWLTHSPQSQRDGRWSLGYPVTLGLTSGDWFEAAQEYRLWAINRLWCLRGLPRDRPLPALTRAQGMWLSHWGGGEAANLVARDLLRHVNAPLRLDWRNWHQGAPPEYFPPRDGEEGFAQAVRELAEAGVYVQLAFSGRDTTPEIAAALTAKAANRGAEGMLFPEAGEAKTVRASLAAARRAVGESYHLALEGLAEPYLEHLDAFVSYDTAAERLGLASARYGARWTPIPLFTTVYHEYCTQVAAGPSLSGVLPHDPDLPREQAEALRLPEALAARDFQPQFCLEIARGMIWGRQLALTGYSPEQGREEYNRRKLAFLAAALRAQTWGVGGMLAEAEFTGLLAIEAPNVDADLLFNPWGRRVAPRVARKRISPVLGAAWRLPGGGNALVMTNLHTQPVEFSTLLRPSRMVLNTPLHLVGRTFSEDGDAPAATLRASGTEIGGRLPARGILLVTLH